MFPYTLDYKSKQDCPIEPCPTCSWPGVWEQPMIDLEDEWLGSNPACPECGNVCSMLDGCVMCVLTRATHLSLITCSLCAAWASRPRSTCTRC